MVIEELNHGHFSGYDKLNIRKLAENTILSFLVNVRFIWLFTFVWLYSFLIKCGNALQSRSVIPFPTVIIY